MPLPDEMGGILSRLAELEAIVHTLQSTTTTTTTTTTSTTAGLSFTAVAETAIALTQDAAWHSVTVAGVPSNAKALLLLVKQKAVNLVATNEFRVTGDTTHATYYTVAGRDCAIGANQDGFHQQVIAPVPASFDYYMDNDPDWTVTVYIQGYFS